MFKSFFFQNIVYRVVCWGGGLVAGKCRVGGRPKQQKPTIAHVLISFFNPELAFKPTRAIETRVPLIALPCSPDDTNKGIYILFIPPRLLAPTGVPSIDILSTYHHLTYPCDPPTYHLIHLSSFPPTILSTYHMLYCAISLLRNLYKYICSQRFC